MARWGDLGQGAGETAAALTGLAVTIDPALVREVESSVPCQWMADAVGAMTCLQPAEWLVWLRDTCLAGGPIAGLQGPTAATLCNEHCSYLLNGFDQRIGQGLLCGGCRKLYGSDPYHLAEWWEKLNGGQP